MAAIVHRRQARRVDAPAASGQPGTPAPRSRTATAAIVVFGGLGLIAAGIELLAAAQAFIEGATDYLGILSPVLPTAFRVGAMVALPAFVAWASPSRPTANGWLWRGALIVSLVTLARDVADPVQQAILENAGEDLTPESLPYLLAQGIGIVLAVASLLGVWALSEGLKDAGALVSRPVVALAAVLGVASGVVVFGPSIYGIVAGDAGGVSIPLFVVSVVVNVLFFITQALLLVRAAAGARRRLRPRMAWIAGAVGATVLFLYPLVSLLRLMLTQYVTGGVDAIPLPDVVFRVAIFFGWPLFAAAIGNGMGRVGWVVVPKLTPTGFTMRGRARLTLPA